MKKTIKIFMFIAVLLSLVFLSLNKITLAEEIVYEDADYVSIADLYRSGKKVGKKIVQTSNTSYVYDKTAKYGSLVFSFIYKNPTWSAQSDGSQIHFYGTWQADGMFWVEPGGNRISYLSNGNKYKTGTALSKDGTYSIELGRLVILKNGTYSGKAYFYIKVNGSIVIEYTHTLDRSLLNSNNIFITGSKGNTLIDSNWNGNKVTYIVNGSKTESFTMDDYISKPADPAVMPGKEFVGWFDSLGNEWDFDNKLTSDVTLTAVYSGGNTIDTDYFSDENFTPVLRFTASSDTHITSKATSRNSYLEKEFEVAYRYAQNSTKYNSLDAALFAGDLSDNGKEDELQSFMNTVKGSIKPETSLIVSMGNHEYGTYTSVSHVVKVFKEVTKQECDYHVVINGYHFIAVSPNYDKGTRFTPTKEAWLKEQLDAAVADNPNQPIFVMQHEAIEGTLYGSDVWGTDAFVELLSKYPQVVDFSGHSHYPISDPRSIWQGSFTALGTGTLHYWEMGINGYKDSSVYPKDSNGGWSGSTTSVSSAAEYLICEVDANNCMRVILYDLKNDCEIGRIYLNNLLDDFKLTYSHSERAKNADIAEFETGSKVTATVEAGKVSVVFDRATCDDVIESYRVKFYKGSTLYRTEYVLSDYFLANPSDKLSVYVAGLEADTTYTVKVYAVNVWDQESTEFLETTLTTD